MKYLWMAVLAAGIVGCGAATKPGEGDPSDARDVDLIRAAEAEVQALRPRRAGAGKRWGRDLDKDPPYGLIPEITALTITPDKRWVIANGIFYDAESGRRHLEFRKLLPQKRKRMAKRRGDLVVNRERWEAEKTAFTANGSLGLSGGSNPTLLLWEVSTGRELQSLDDGGRAGYVAMTSDGRFALTGHYARQLTLWDLSQGKRLRKMGETPPEAYQGNEAIGSIRFLRDQNRALVECPSGGMQLWDLNAGRPIRTFQGFYRSRLLAVSADDRFALSEKGIHALSYELLIWDISTGKVVRRLRGHEREIHAAAFYPKENAILSGSLDGTIKCWDLATGNVLWTLRVTAKRFYTTAVAFSHDGALAVTGGRDGGVKVWDTAQRKCVRVLIEGRPNPRHGQVIEELGERLQDPDAAVRRAAAAQLGESGRDGAKLLGSVLNDPDTEVRRTAASSLLGIGYWAADAFPALARGLADKDDQVRLRSAATMLLIDGGFKTARQVLQVASKDPDVRVRKLAVECLHATREAGAAELCAALDDSDAEVRRRAAELLRDVPISGEGPPPGLAKALQSQDAVVRVLAAGEIHFRWRVLQREVAAALCESLQVKEVTVRRKAAELLCRRTQPQEQGTQPALRAALKDKDQHVRTFAGVALVYAGDQSDEVVRALIDGLANPDRACSAAVHALGKLGLRAEPAIPGLVRVLGYRKGFGIKASHTVAKIGPSAVEPLAAAVGSTDKETRNNAIFSLGYLGPRAKDAVPALVACLRSTPVDEQTTRVYLLRAFRRIGPPAKAAVPTLIGLLNDEDGEFRADCARTLGAIGPDAKEAIPALKAALKDKCPPMSFHAAQALEKIGVKPPKEGKR
jgi:HEAT repeat protein